MEFLTLEQMDERKQLWNDTPYMDDLTVFAIDGYGNLFAWKEDESVVFIDIGLGLSRDFSMTLSDAIYRRVIEFSSGEYVKMCSNEEKAGMDPDDAEDYTSESSILYLISFLKYGIICKRISVQDDDYYYSVLRRRHFVGYIRLPCKLRLRTFFPVMQSHPIPYFLKSLHGIIWKRISFRVSLLNLIDGIKLLNGKIRYIDC